MDENKEKLLWEYFTLMLKAMRLGSGLFDMTIEDKMTTMLQLHALIFIKENPRLTVGEFAQEFHMSSPSVAQFTRRLINAGFIKKESDPKDRRVTRLFLTLKGETTSKVLPENLMKKINGKFDLFYYFPEDDIRTIINIIKKFIKKAEARKL